MPKYKYRAKKGPDEVFEGRLEADSQEEAIEKISQSGFLPIGIELMKTEAKDSSQVTVNKGRFRVKSREITIFSRQLASLLKAGVPILHAINIIQEQSENRDLKSVLTDVYNSVKEGSTLSSVMSKYPRVFPSLYIAMVRSGENSGSLPEVLLRIADYRAKEDEMISRFRMALAYPILMACVGIATVVFMLTFVMPRLMGIFSNIGKELPLPTQILIAISQGLREWWMWIILGVIAFAVVAKLQSSTKTGKVSLSIFSLHMPILGNFVLKSELSRFCRTMEMLIKNGIPILNALETSIPVLENEIIKNKLYTSYKDLEQGGSFGKSLKDADLFPLFMSNLVIVGEESGQLEDALGEIADCYERDTDEMMKVMSSLLEPLMILVMGLIVGFIVISMLLPIFQINLMVG
ncbi:MAG: type II secretion system F family protein [Candidatus Omnitrophica bacterium]|nr:type II secretion system F family protein [Candidatus Omnitrophota bacterium]